MNAAIIGPLFWLLSSPPMCIAQTRPARRTCPPQYWENLLPPSTYAIVRWLLYSAKLKLLTWKVSSYCFLALRSSTVVHSRHEATSVVYSRRWHWSTALIINTQTDPVINRSSYACSEDQYHQWFCFLNGILKQNDFLIKTISRGSFWT